MIESSFFNNRKQIYFFLFFLSIPAAFTADYALIFRIKAMVISCLSVLAVVYCFIRNSYDILQNPAIESENPYTLKKWKTNFIWQHERLLLFGLSLYTLNFYFILSVFVFFYLLLKKPIFINKEVKILKSENSLLQKLKIILKKQKVQLLVVSFVYMALDITREFSVWHTVIFRPIVLIMFGIILFIYCISFRFKS